MTLLCQVDDYDLSTETLSLMLARDHVSVTDRNLIEENVIESLVGAPTHIDMFTSLGPLMVIGPLQERLRGAAIAGTVTRSFVEALMRLGVPPGAATCYGDGLRMGRILLSIHTRVDADRVALNRIIAHIGGDRSRADFDKT